MKKIILLLLFLAIVILSRSQLRADTVILSNNQKVKGVVVEEFSDRVIISTIDGEQKIMKQDIKNIIYDMEEQNLTSLGDFYQDKAMYRKAYYYYDKALKINPEFKKARDGLNYVATHIQQKDRMRKLNHIRQMNEGIKRKRPGRGAVITEKKPVDKIKDEIGFSLGTTGEKFVIDIVKDASPAGKAGLKSGDIILSVWGRSISYMEPHEVRNKLSDSGVMDIQMTISRKYMLSLKEESKNHGNYLGIEFGFSEMDGLIIEDVHPSGIAHKNGMIKGDMVYEIQGESTRYMPLKEVLDIVNSRKEDVLELKIKRDLVVWKKFDQ